MDVVKKAVEHSLRESICGLSAETGIHCCSVQRIPRTDLHLFPYKIQSQSEHTPQQMARRIEFATWFSGKLETDD